MDGKLYHDKPTLRIGRHGHTVAMHVLADRPLRLERNGYGIYYWSMVRGGEFHWWLTVECNEGPKTGENGVSGSGTH